MRILHTSDIHLDSPLTSRLPADRVRERRRELLSGFGRMVEEAKEMGALAVIIAGDLFDSERVSRRAMDTALDIIESAPEVVFFYLQGNHEGDALSLSGRAIPLNLKTFGKDWTYYEAGSLTVVGRSEIREGMFESLDLPKDSTNIVVLHGELRDKSAYPDAIGLGEAAGRNIDYMALGHYHSHSIKAIDDRGVAVYSGTPEGRGFDETGEKGYMIIDTTPRLKYSLRPFARRRLHTISIDLGGLVRTAEILERAERALRTVPSTDIVRLELVGRYFPTLWKDLDSLTHAFENRFYYFEIKDCSRMAINPEDYKNDKSLKGEFIRTVTSDQSLDEQTKEKIIACGINALMGEELFD
jgi:DNA repair exonuclease SbcCD nuclease subunit